MKRHRKKTKSKQKGGMSDAQSIFADPYISDHFQQNFDALFDVLDNKKLFKETLAQQKSICHTFDIVNNTGEILLRSVMLPEFGNTLQYCLYKKEYTQNFNIEMIHDNASKECFKKTKVHLSKMLEKTVQKYYQKYMPLYVYGSQDDEGLNGLVFLHKNHVVYMTVFASSFKSVNSDIEYHHLDFYTKYIDKSSIVVNRYMDRNISATDRWKMIFNHKYLEAFHDAMLSHTKPRSQSFNIFEKLLKDEIFQIFEYVKSDEVLSNQQMSDYIFQYLLKPN